MYFYRYRAVNPNVLAEQEIGIPTPKVVGTQLIKK